METLFEVAFTGINLDTNQIKDHKLSQVIEQIARKSEELKSIICKNNEIGLKTTIILSEILNRPYPR